jgi:hypothetical protein
MIFILADENLLIPTSLFLAPRKSLLDASE